MLLPGAALRYSGADLGFDNALIAAAGNLAGLIVPWRAGNPFSMVSIVYEKVAGASSSVSLQAQAYDFDGQTALAAAFTSFLNTVADDIVAQVEGTLLVALAGTVVAAGVPLLLSSPYLRFRILNNDGVNTVNVRLQAILTP